MSRRPKVLQKSTTTAYPMDRDSERVGVAGGRWSPGGDRRTVVEYATTHRRNAIVPARSPRESCSVGEGEADVPLRNTPIDEKGRALPKAF
jgi:hypothetical protein